MPGSSVAIKNFLSATGAARKAAGKELVQASGQRLAQRSAEVGATRAVNRSNAQIRSNIKRSFVRENIDMPKNMLEAFYLTKQRQREAEVGASPSAREAYKSHYGRVSAVRKGARVAARTGLGAGVGFLAGGPIGATVGGGLGLASGIHSARNPSMGEMKFRHRYALKQAHGTGKKVAKLRKLAARRERIMNYKSDFREGIYEADPQSELIKLHASTMTGQGKNVGRKVGRLAGLKNRLVQSKYVQKSIPRLKKTGAFFGDVRHMPKTARDLVFAPKGPKGFRSGLAKRLGKQALALEVGVGGALLARKKIKQALQNRAARKVQQEDLDEGWGTAIGGAFKSAGSWLGKSKNVYTGAKDYLKARHLLVVKSPSQQFADSVKGRAWGTVKSGLKPAGVIAGTATAAGYGGYRALKNRRNEDMSDYLDDRTRAELIEAIMDEALKDKAKAAAKWAKEKAQAGGRAVGRAGKWSGKKIVAGGKAVGRGGKFVGKKVAAGGRWSGKKIVAGGKAVGKGGKWLATTKKGRITAAAAAAAGGAGYGAYRYAKKHRSKK